MRLGVSLEVVERLVSQYLLHLVDRLKLSYVDVRECREALSEEEVAPVDAREVLHESVVCHLVVVGLHVAQLYLALACLGDASLVSGVLGEAIGKLYVEKYFPESSKQQMIQLVRNLQKALSQRIDEATWMSPATKAKR